MIYIFAIIIVLGVLVFVHELGHFLAAKIFGVRVERFSIGFPPRLFGVQLGETDYCVSAIPLGGYVKLNGMVDESLDVKTLEEDPKPYEFRAKPTYQKVIIITAGVIMNVVLAVVILAGMFWFQGEPITPTTRVGYVEEGGVAKKIGFRKYDEIIGVAGQPVHNWQEIGQIFFENLGNDIHFTVKRGKELKTLVLKWDEVNINNIERLDIEPLFPAIVGELSGDFPAIKAGLQTGDRIIAINDSSVASWDEMTKIVRNNPGNPLEFAIVRNNETLMVEITPRAVSEDDGQNGLQTVGRIGIAFYLERRELDFLSAVAKGFNQTMLIGELNVKGFLWIISGRESAREILVGPIGITKIAGDIAKTSFANLIMLIAHLSIVLAIINILPIPALDGGHLMIILIEGIRRRPISIKAKMVVQQIGMVFLLMIIFFVIYNDLARLFN